jgi:hypothetical protein
LCLLLYPFHSNRYSRWLYLIQLSRIALTSYLFPPSMSVSGGEASWCWYDPYTSYRHIPMSAKLFQCESSHSDTFLTTYAQRLMTHVTTKDTFWCLVMCWAWLGLKTWAWAWKPGLGPESLGLALAWAWPWPGLGLGLGLALAWALGSGKYIF